jgi:hypothetical protein
MLRKGMYLRTSSLAQQHQQQRQQQQQQQRPHTMSQLVLASASQLHM